MASVQWRHLPDSFKQIKKTKRPIVLSVNGKAHAIVQDAEAYLRLLDIAARADIYEVSKAGRWLQRER